MVRQDEPPRRIQYWGFRRFALTIGQAACAICPIPFTLTMQLQGQTTSVKHNLSWHDTSYRDHGSDGFTDTPPQIALGLVIFASLCPCEAGYRWFRLLALYGFIRGALLRWDVFPFCPVSLGHCFA